MTRHQENYWFWRNRQRCCQCHREDAYTLAGHVYCADCTKSRVAAKRAKYAANSEHYKQQNRAYAESRMEAGLCRFCREPAEPGKTMCKYHLLQARNRQRHSYAAAHPEGYKRDQPEICLRCTSPAMEGRRYCPEHYKKQVEICQRIRQLATTDHPWRKDDEITFWISRHVLNSSGKYSRRNGSST